jgi:MarR family transcriptional regulator for hemolysin
MAPEQTPDEGGPGCDLARSLAVVLRALHRSMADVVGDLPHGPRGFQVLATVVHGDQPSQLALAEHLGIDRTVMTYLIDDLVADGLVERQPNPSDRRQRKIVATPKGRRTLTRLERQVREAEDQVLGALDPVDRHRFRDALGRVAGALGDDGATVTCDEVA